MTATAFLARSRERNETSADQATLAGRLGDAMLFALGQAARSPTEDELEQALGDVFDNLEPQELQRLARAILTHLQCGSCA